MTTQQQHYPAALPAISTLPPIDAEPINLRTAELEQGFAYWWREHGTTLPPIGEIVYEHSKNQAKAAFIVGATEYPPLPNWEQAVSDALPAPTPWKFFSFVAGVIVGMGSLMWLMNFIDAR